MCGRFTLFHNHDEVIDRFQVQNSLFDISPRYNIAPSQPVATITDNGTRTMQAAKWGLVPFWAKDDSMASKLINARAETLAEKASFKQAFQKRRCLIPADGFYEWRKEGKTKQPVYIRLRSQQLFCFAGLWEEWKTPEGSTLRTCTIITVPPNELIAPMHHRMAVILKLEQEALWLDSDVKDIAKVAPLLQPYESNEMEFFAVSRKVNSAMVEGADCIAPAAEQLPLYNL